MKALVALLLTAVALPAAAESPACIELRVLGDAERPSASFKRAVEAPEAFEALALEDVEWRLLAEGSALGGELVLRFAGYTGSADAAAILRVVTPPDLRLEAPALTVAGDEIPLAAARAKPQSAPADARQDPRGRRAAPAAPEPLVGEWSALVSPGEDVVVRLRVEGEAPLASGAFHAVLPAISSRCSQNLEGPAPRLSLRVAGGGVSSATSPKGTVTIEQDGSDDVLVLDRADEAAGPRPLALSWKLEGEDETSGRARLRELPDGRREISVVVTAPAQVDESLVRARDVVFVLDASGSMARDRKLDVAKDAVRAALRTLRAADAFNVLAFREVVVPAMPLPRGGEDALASVGSFLLQLRSQGGTRLEPALAEAFAQRRDGPGHRVVVVLSDGIVGDERPVLDLVASAPKDARLLLVAIGPDARFDVLRRIAEAGGGEALRVADPAELGRRLEPFLASFATPVAWDLAVDWDGATVTDIRPARISDLHAGRPVTLRAIVEDRPPARVRIRGTTADGEEGLDLLVPVETSP